MKWAGCRVEDALSCGDVHKNVLPICYTAAWYYQFSDLIKRDGTVARCLKHSFFMANVFKALFAARFTSKQMSATCSY